MKLPEEIIQEKLSKGKITPEEAEKQLKCLIERLKR